jgi:predicted DNA-binding transcriptional regulator AlpA
VLTKAKENALQFDTLLTAKDLAELYCLSTREVYRRAAAGLMPSGYKIGHHTRRWKASEIQAHLDSLKPLS